MRELLGLLGFVSLVQGLLGLLHEFTGLHLGLLRRLGFLDGYEVYASVALVVLAFALFAAADSGKAKGGEPGSGTAGGGEAEGGEMD